MPRRRHTRTGHAPVVSGEHLDPDMELPQAAQRLGWEPLGRVKRPDTPAASAPARPPDRFLLPGSLRPATASTFMPSLQHPRPPRRGPLRHRTGRSPRSLPVEDPAAAGIDLLHRPLGDQRAPPRRRRRTLGAFAGVVKGAHPISAPLPQRLKMRLPGPACRSRPG